MGPDWPCLCVTYSLVIVPSVAFLIWIAPPLHPAIIAVEVLLLVGTLVALTLTACSNPGTVPKQTAEQLEYQRRLLEESGASVDNYTTCQHCNVFRKAGTTHCYDCNACCVELDHHCPWTGHCIGQKNLTAFYSFLWSILALMLFTGGSFFAWVVQIAALPKQA